MALKVIKVDKDQKFECCKCGWIGIAAESADLTPVIDKLWLLVCPKCGNKEEFFAAD